jgi:Cu+-exporting ATPase
MRVQRRNEVRFVKLAIASSVLAFVMTVSAQPPKEIPSGAFRVRVTERGYEPAKLEIPAGQPVTVAFVRESASGCGAEVVFRSVGIRKALPVGETVLVSLPPQPAGEIKFSCGMGMLRGVIVAQ